MAKFGKRKYNLTDFFSNYFNNFGRMLLANLFFCIPLAGFSTGLYFLMMKNNGISIFLVLLLIPLMSPFFAGLINSLRKLTAEKKVHPVKDFFGGIKQNWKFFFVNSIMLYLFSAGLWLSIEYIKSNPGNTLFIIYMILMCLADLIFILVELSAVVMAVTVDIKFPELVRNSFILIVNGFTNHLKTLLTLLFAAAVIYSIAALINNPIISLIVLGVLMLTIIPSMVLYIIVYNSYQNIEKHVIDPYLEEKKHEQKLSLQKAEDEKLTIEDLQPLAIGDPEEYVSLNGKTIKRKTVVKMIEARRNSIES